MRLTAYLAQGDGLLVDEVGLRRGGHRQRPWSDETRPTDLMTGVATKTEALLAERPCMVVAGPGGTVRLGVPPGGAPPPPLLRLR